MFKNFFGFPRSQRKAAHPSTRRGFRPAVECLESREVLTTLLPGFTESTITTGLVNPTAMEFAPDGRLFVLEQGGNVKLVHSDGTTFTALHLNVDSSGERGLLGIAFDPNFSSDHYVYLYYTNPNPGAGPWATGEHNQLSRFTVNDSNPLQPVFQNETPILDWNNLVSATNHNGGAIHFGADGMLYADAGDNTQTFVGPDGNTYRVSQTLNDLLGKQLRIDVANFNSGVATRDDTTVGHLIPSDNPFVGQATGINQLIYVLGLRNPFTFAVQPGTGTIYINDVGENTWEEIDQSIAGGNYGWQGGNTDGFGHPPPAFAAGTYHDPLLAYNHTGGPAGGGDAIVGGTFYDPASPSFPSSYIGKYFYEDLGAGWIRVFDPAHPGTAANPDTSTAFASGTPGGLRDLKVDANGNLFYLSGGDGSVREISYGVVGFASQPASTTIVQGHAGSFSITPTGVAPFTYQWQKFNGTSWVAVTDGGDISGSATAQLQFSSAVAADAGQYRVVVQNAFDSATSNSATLTVGTAPWSPWQSQGGFVSQLTSALDPNNEIELFGIGGDNAAWVKSESVPAGPFGGWQSLGGFVKQIVVGTNADGTLELFGIGGDNAAWFRQQQNNAGTLTWTPWQPLDGFVKQLAVGRDPLGDLELFGIGGDNAAWVLTQTAPEGTFGNWSSLGGFVKQITVGNQQNETLAVFGIGADNAAWVRQQQDNSDILSWTPWQSLGGFVKQLAVGLDPKQNLELFGIGGDNAVWVNTQATPNAGTFGVWQSLGGFVTQIVVAANPDTTLTVFGIGGDNATWFRRQTSATDLSFLNWASLGGFVKQLSAANEINHDLALFGIGGDIAAWLSQQSSS